MNILDIFSWLPEKEIRLEDIERIALNLNSGAREEDGFTLSMELPDSKNEYHVAVANELAEEGKKVCCLSRNGSMIAIIGYKD